MAKGRFHALRHSNAIGRPRVRRRRIYLFGEPTPLRRFWARHEYRIKCVLFAAAFVAGALLYFALLGGP